jgi:hypothetical protein
MDRLHFAATMAVAVQIVEYLMSTAYLYEADDQLAMSMVESDSDMLGDIQIALSNAVLHDYQVTLNLLTSNCELKWYVLPRSTMWFADFLMTKYDRQRWIKIFRMSKETFLDICEHLWPLIQRQNTKYRDAICIECRVACALYTLA